MKHTLVDNQDATTIAEQCECDHTTTNDHHHGIPCSYQQHSDDNCTNSICSSCEQCSSPQQPTTCHHAPNTDQPSMDDRTRSDRILEQDKKNAYADDHLPLGGQYPVLIASSKKRRLRQRRCAIGKILVYTTFMIIILGGITTFFCWPRTPMVAIGSHAQQASAQNTWATTKEKRPWMESTWLMNITLDNRENWIPTRLARIELTMVDSVTRAAFATATVTDLTLAPGMLVVVPNIAFHVAYSTRLESDTTWQDLYRACGPQHGPQPSLNVNMKIVFHFQGILWTSVVNASPPSGGFICPQ